jgi:hypothetical protein
MTFGKSVISKLLDVYPAHTALIDQKGRILVVNRAWKRFGAQNGLTDPQSCEDANYLDECERAHFRGSRGAKAVYDGIHKVLSGAVPSFSYSYTCHSPSDKRWFHLIAAPFDPSGERGWAVLLHVETTHERKLATRYSRRLERSLQSVTVCAWCRLIQCEPGEWEKFEEFFAKRQGIQFSHGICNHCLSKLLENPSS